MNFSAIFDFGSGGTIGPFDLRDAVPSERECSDSFHHAVSQWSIKFIPTSAYLTARVATKSDIVVSIFEDDALAFKGLVAPTDSWSDDGATVGGTAAMNDVSLEVLDYSSWLDREIKDEDAIAWEDAPICDPAHAGASIVHRLLSLCNLGGMFTAVETESTILHAFTIEAGNTVGSALDDLLFQWGLVLAWRIDHFETHRWLNESPTPVFDFTADNILGSLVTERVAREADAVEVEWYALKDKSACLLYMADLPFSEDGHRSGYPIQPGLLWPEAANTEETWFSYEDAGLLYTGLDYFGDKKENTDFSSLVLTKNQTVDGKVDVGIVGAFAPIYQNMRARLAFRNPTAASLNIYYCDIYGDVIYRSTKNSVVKNSVDSPKSTKTISAQYVFTSAQPTKLACALADQYGTACWRHTIKSESRVAVGTIVSVYDAYQGVTSTALLVERSRDIESGIYSYKAITLSPITINPTASYQSVLLGPSTSSSDSRVQAAAALARSVELAKVIYLNLSTSTLARSRAGVFSPGSISAQAAYADKVAALVRFVVETSPDGEAWTARYTSAADESSISYVPNVACSYIRVSIFEAGGTVTLLKATVLTVTLDVSAIPVYWGPLLAPPTVGIVSPDFFFDINPPNTETPTAGGGWIRYYNAGQWQIMPPTHYCYAYAYSQSMNDRLVWCSAHNVDEAGAVKVFEAIAASRAMFSKLSTQEQYSAALCDDGITPRSSFDWDSALLTLRSGDQEKIIELVDGILTSYSGIGAARTLLRHSGAAIEWANSPEGGVEKLIGSMHRDDTVSKIILSPAMSTMVDTGLVLSPKPLSGTKERKSCIIYNGKLYIPESYGTTLEIYDLKTNTYVTKTLPDNVVNYVVLQYNGKLYMPRYNSGAITIYDVDHDTFETITSRPRYIQHAHIYKGKLYNIAGAVHDIEVLDLTAKTLAYVGTRANDFSVSACELDDGKIYMFPEAGSSDPLLIYNIDQGSYETVSLAANAHRGSFSVKYNGKIYIPSATGTILEIFDIAAKTMATKTLPNNVSRFAILQNDDKLYMPQYNGTILEVYDILTDTFSTLSISSATTRVTAAVYGGTLYIPGNNNALIELISFKIIAQLGTGVIKEGSNSLGSWVIYGNGLMIQRGEYDETFAAMSGIQVSIPNFPKAFGSKPIAVGCQYPSTAWSGFTSVTVSPYTSTNFLLALYNTVAQQVIHNDWIAIGVAP
jgi:hypothetical protein